MTPKCAFSRLVNASHYWFEFLMGKRPFAATDAVLLPLSSTTSYPFLFPSLLTNDVADADGASNGSRLRDV